MTTSADQFDLTEAQKKQLLPSDYQRVIANRIGWAKTYLLKAGLLNSPKRGIISSTAEGLKVLAQQPEKITVELLSQYPSFQVKGQSRTKETVYSSREGIDLQIFKRSERLCLFSFIKNYSDRWERTPRLDVGGRPWPTYYRKLFFEKARPRLLE